MAEFDKDAPEFVPGKLNLVSKVATSTSVVTDEKVTESLKDEKKSDPVDDVTETIAKVRIKHDFEGERKNYRDTMDHLRSGMKFSELNIPAPCLQALTHDMRYTEPTQIQAETIPVTLAGRNVLAQAQAGSGKSIAFSIAILNRIDTSVQQVQAICLAPNRHLASQIHDDALVSLSKYFDPPCRTELAVRSIDPSDKGPPKGAVCPAQVVVGTPGTVIKYIKSKYINANAVKIFVVDEADEMIKESEKGNSANVLSIKKKLPKAVQTLFFSATYPPQIKDLAKNVVGDKAVWITVEKLSDLILDKIFQVKIELKDREKIDILEDVYSFITIQQSIVFCETKAECNEVKKTLNKRKFACSVIHRDIANADEEFELFRQNKTQVLIATNILARGIDVPSVAIVINYDVPRLYSEKKGSRGFGDTADCETYSHRISRCCRMGNPGTAISLIKTQTDARVVRQVEQYYDTNLHSWKEDDIEELARAHNALQGGALQEDIVVEFASCLLNAKADATDWAA